MDPRKQTLRTRNCTLQALDDLRESIANAGLLLEFFFEVGKDGWVEQGRIGRHDGGEALRMVLRLGW